MTTQSVVAWRELIAELQRPAPPLIPGQMQLPGCVNVDTAPGEASDVNGGRGEPDTRFLEPT